MSNARAGRLISIGGSKGAGSSVVAVNLAVALAQDGARVALVGAAPSVQGTQLQADVPGLRITPTPRLTPQAARALDADVVVIDLGDAGEAEAQPLLDAADLWLVAVTPERASAEAAYTLLRGAVFRELTRLAAAAGQRARLDEALAGAEPTASTAQLLARLAQGDAALAADLQAAVAGLVVRLVGNRIVEARDTEIVFALSRMAHDFLGLEAPVLGSLRTSPRLHAAASQGLAYLLQPEADGEECAATLRTAARALRAVRVTRSPAAAAALDEAPPASPPPAALPVDVADYQRAYQRHLVDLPATLVYPGGLLQAQLKDISEGGTLLELDRPPPAGTRITLVVPGLGDHPGLACVVRHADARRRRAGVQFICEPEEGRRLCQAIQGLGIDRLLDGEVGRGRCL